MGSVALRDTAVLCAPSTIIPEENNYILNHLDAGVGVRVADRLGEEVLERRYDAFPRLLAGFRAVHGGIAHDLAALPAYGGDLFDPECFPFLEGRAPGSDWRSTPARPCPIHNRTGGREKRRLSFRALDIEQIGHVYEGLLDHTARRAMEIVLGLDGKEEPKVALSEVNPTVTWRRGQPAPPTGRC
jgi:hypothetical protein